jgi:hypothetical protein
MPIPFFRESTLLKTFSVSTPRTHAGQVQAAVDRDDGALLLPDDAGGHRGGRRDLIGVRRGQPHGAGRGGRAQLSGGGDPGVHGAGGSARRGLHEPQGAEPGQAAARHQRLHARRRRPHVHAGQVGLVTIHLLLSALSIPVFFFFFLVELL